MIHVSLTPDESLDLLEILSKNNEKSLLQKLKNEISNNMKELYEIDNTKKLYIAQKWMNNQLKKIEELKNDSK